MSDDHIVDEQQRRVALLLGNAGPAMPPALRVRLDQLEQDGRRSRRSRSVAVPVHWRRRWIVGVASLATAAIAPVVVLGVAGGPASPALTANRVAALWTLPATTRAIAPSHADPTELAVNFRGTAFPNYHDHEGWHPAGARADTIDGSATRTVFYMVGDRRAAYTVVAGTRVSVPANARRFTNGGVPLREFRDGDHWVIVFRDHGNTCVLTAAAPREKHWLIALAVWARA